MPLDAPAYRIRRPFTVPATAHLPMARHFEFLAKELRIGDSARSIPTTFLERDGADPRVVLSGLLGPGAFANLRELRYIIEDGLQSWTQIDVAPDVQELVKNRGALLAASPCVEPREEHAWASEISKAATQREQNLYGLVEPGRVFIVHNFLAYPEHLTDRRRWWKISRPAVIMAVNAPLDRDPSLATVQLWFSASRDEEFETPSVPVRLPSSCRGRLRDLHVSPERDVTVSQLEFVRYYAREPVCKLDPVVFSNLRRHL